MREVKAARDRAAFTVYIVITVWYSSLKRAGKQEEAPQMSRNQVKVIPKKNGAGIITYGPNGFWMKTGHCRRCVNGLGHSNYRKGAGGEKSTGLLLQRPGAHIYEDEIAPGEKKTLRRQVRMAEKEAIRREISEEA
jgi:hypothetical protein